MNRVACFNLCLLLTALCGVSGCVTSRDVTIEVRDKQTGDAISDAHIRLFRPPLFGVFIPKSLRDAPQEGRTGEHGRWTTSVVAGRRFHAEVHHEEYGWHPEEGMAVFESDNISTGEPLIIELSRLENEAH